MNSNHKSGSDLAYSVLELIENSTKTTTWQPIVRGAFVRWYREKKCLILAKQRSKKFHERMWDYEAHLIAQKLSKLMSTKLTVSVTRLVSYRVLGLPGPTSYHAIKIFVGEDNNHNLSTNEIAKELNAEKLKVN